MNLSTFRNTIYSMAKSGVRREYYFNANSKLGYDISLTKLLDKKKKCKLKLMVSFYYASKNKMLIGKSKH